MRSRLYKLRLAVLAVLLALPLFQNCAGFRSATSATGATGLASSSGLPCVFNGQTVGVGGSVVAYLNSSGSCQSETRVCQPSGALSGSYNFSTCTTAGAAACLFDGRTIADGASVTAYAAAAGPTCASETRTCANGVLSGGYAFASCQTGGAAACLFNGRTIASGQSTLGFAQSSVASGGACVPQTRTCTNGVLSGAGDFASCVVGGGAACAWNGQTLADGQVVTGYQSSTGQTCASETRTCANGTLSGSYAFASCTAGGTSGASCLINGQTVASGASVSLFPQAVVGVGASCQAELRTCANGTLSGSATNTSCFARQASVSASYVPPAAREGISDQRYDDPSPLMDTRYAVFRQMGLGYKEYNYFWSRFEPGTVTPSASPVNCPADQMMVPADAGEMSLRGYHHYRCLSRAVVTMFDQMLTRDAASGLQSGIVFWSAPPIYRDPKCLGSPWAGSTLFDGCVPRDDAMDDYEDALTFLALRYNGLNGFGKISHFIIWNENASAVWFDYSPNVATRGRLTTGDQNKWVAKYADMVRRAHAAIQRGTAGVMIDVSLDNQWLPPSVSTTAPAHIGEKTLIDGLWAALGTSINWSVAVHPYGDLDQVPRAGTYSFLNVDDVVGTYQRQKLSGLGLDPNALRNPQGYLIASEQGWPQSEGIQRQAQFICWAHAITMQSGIVAQAHNYFQSIEPQESSGGASGQGAFFGLLPYRSAADLSDLASFATGAAYQATNPSRWGRSNAHYCCQAAGVGCAVPAGLAPVYRYHSTKHFQSTQFREGLLAGMTFDARVFNIYVSPGADLVGVYRCRAGTDAFLSTSSNCEGQTTDGLLGYVHQTAGSGLVPVFRKFNATAGDHLITLNADEGSPSYALETVIGYVPAP